MSFVLLLMTKEVGGGLPGYHEHTSSSSLFTCTSFLFLWDVQTVCSLWYILNHVITSLRYSWSSHTKYPYLCPLRRWKTLDVISIGELVEELSVYKKKIRRWKTLGGVISIVELVRQLSVFKTIMIYCSYLFLWCKYSH